MTTPVYTSRFKTLADLTADLERQFDYLDNTGIYYEHYTEKDQFFPQPSLRRMMRAELALQRRPFIIVSYSVWGGFGIEGGTSTLKFSGGIQFPRVKYLDPLFALLQMFRGFPDNAGDGVNICRIRMADVDAITQLVHQLHTDEDLRRIIRVPADRVQLPPQVTKEKVLAQHEKILARIAERKGY
jgi:hypothetical protein